MPRKKCNGPVDDSYRSKIIGFRCNYHVSGPSYPGSLEPNSDGELTCGNEEHSIRFNPTTAEMRVVRPDGIFKFDCDDFTAAIGE
jgi:hypothetical protein